MDGFLNIKWDSALDEFNSFFNRDIFVSSSAAYHRVHNIPQSPWPPNQDDKKEQENKWNPCQLKREDIVGVNGQGKVRKIEMPNPLPKKSILSGFEQRDYNFALIRILKAFITGAPCDPSDLLKLKELRIKLSDEQKEYQELAQTTMLQNPRAYSILNPGIATYVSELWNIQLSKVREMYPPCYKLIGSACLIPKENIKSIGLNLDRTVLELGKIPSPIFPTLNTIIKIKRDWKMINKRFPNAELESEPVSKDSNAIKLAQRCNVDVVISSVGIRSLAGNVAPLFRNTWDIPFRVEEVKIDSEIRRIVFIDDPLPPTEMTAIDKNELFSRFAIKYHFSNPNYSRYFIYPGSKHVVEPYTENTTDGDDLFGNVDINSADTFGVDAFLEPLPVGKSREEKTTSDSSVRNKSKEDNQKLETSLFPPSEIPTANASPTKKASVDIEMSSELDSSDDSLVIDTGDEDDRSPRKRKKKFSKMDQCSAASDASENSLKMNADVLSSPTKQVKKTTNKQLNISSAPANLMDSILQGQQTMIDSQRKVSRNSSDSSTFCSENPKDYIQPKRNHNVTFRTWDFRANERSLRLLIRSSVDTAVGKDNGELRSFLMVPKNEYQPWYGGEITSPREYSEQWMDLHLRPECKQFRVRLDVYTGDVIESTQKGASCLAAESCFQYGEQFRADKCLQTVWAVLSSLTDMNLRAGSYLLRHGTFDGMCIQVWSATDEQPSASTFNLHQTYANIDTTATTKKEPNENWVALDPLAVLPIHRATSRAPLTFEPKEGSLIQPRPKPNQGGKNKKNIKGKQAAGAKSKK